MIKSNKGISLVSLIITIAVMLIIASISIDMSLDRFEINNYNKMINDLELLENKVSNYYLKFNTIPIARDDENNAIRYTYTTLEFGNAQEENYYIVDLEALEDGVTLNYGKEGFENLNESDDVYIINEKTHSIYYVKGIEMKGEYYYSNIEENNIDDTIPPSKPEIKIISGTQNEEGKYTTEVKLEIIPGKDNWSGVSKTEYSIDENTWNDLSDLENNILILSEEGIYNIVAKTYDKSNNESTTDTLTIEIIVETQELLENNESEENQVDES